MGSSERVERLKQKMLAPPEICIERGYLMTESYKETEAEPPVIRRAKALKKIMEEMTIGIEDGELIVGNTTSKVRGGPLIPEVHQWYLEEMDTISAREWDRYAPLTEEEKAKMRESLPYWNGKSLYEKWHAILPKYATNLVHKIVSGPAYCTNNHHIAHIGIDGRVVNRGLNGIKKEVDERIAKLNLTDIRDLEKLQFLRAVNITLEAVPNFAKRYAELARSLAEKEPNAQRKAELEKIAEACDWVPANPARSFYEALQSVWLTYVALMIEGWGNGIGFGRPDQYLYPLYKKDIEEGKITKEEARELIELVYVKLNGSVVPQGSEMVRTFAGHAIWANIALGGITKEGKDAVNELTYLFLDAEENVKLMSEDLIVRIHKSNPDAYVIRAVEVLKTLRGKFKFVSDETTIKQLMRDGKPEEYARDYVVTGCISPGVPGFSHDLPGGMFNMPLMVELALNNGASRLTGEQIGPKTGNPRKFKSYDEVWDAYKKQAEALMPIAIMLANAGRKLYAEFCPTPFQSALFSGCIEKGIDITAGGTAPYMSHALLAAGTPNAGDSLSAIKKVVFEDKKITMDRLIDALDKNFEGEEEILYMLKNAPKFGNDDEYVDSIMCELFDHASSVVAKYESLPGGVANLAALTVTANLPLGLVVGALPDGRRAGEPLADGGVSPCQGRNVSGPTATLRSVAKIDHTKVTGGSVLNMRFNPDALKDETKIRKFASLIRTFFETGGPFVQFNVVSTDTLRDAQKHPEKYRDLLVRVSTYSAYFVELSPELQEDIIARMEIQEV